MQPPATPYWPSQKAPAEGTRRLTWAMQTCCSWLSYFPSGWRWYRPLWTGDGMAKRRVWLKDYDANKMKKRLALAHQSAQQASDHAGRLLEKIADLERQVAMRDRVIHSLRQAVFQLQEESLADSRMRDTR